MSSPQPPQIIEIVRWFLDGDDEAAAAAGQLPLPVLRIKNRFALAGDEVYLPIPRQMLG